MISGSFKRFINIGLIFLASIAFLLGCAILIVVNLDSNRFKPAIQYWVKENTQRSFKITGDLQLVFYPHIDIRMNDLRLSEYQNEDQFASIDQVHLSLSLWSLLYKQVIVDHVRVKGLNARLIRYQDGRMNIDDLLKEDTEPLAFSFDIGKGEIAMGHLVLQDEMTEQTVVVDNLNLTAARITAETIKQINLKSQFARTEIESVSSDSQAHPATFDIRIDANNIVFNDQKFFSDTITASIQGLESDKPLNAFISVAGLHRSDGQFYSKHLHAELNSMQNEHAVEIVLDTAFTGQLNNRKLTFPDFETRISFSHSEYEKPVQGHLAGRIDLDLVSELLHMEFQGMLVDSHLDAEMHLQGFSEKSLLFNIQLDHVNLDTLLPLQPLTSQADTDKQRTELTANSIALPDFSMLEQLDLNGAIHIGQLLVRDIRVSGIQLSIKPGQHHFDVNKPVH
ncbi:MAG: AsmA family protein [Burkholderiales bacterium]|nr:AsmA family protein [Nitrosomonas sp.]MCP5275358.1 AsmA family protein [Burkholderiales bacterium]